MGTGETLIIKVAEGVKFRTWETLCEREGGGYSLIVSRPPQRTVKPICIPKHSNSIIARTHPILSVKTDDQTCIAQIDKEGKAN